MKLWQCNRTPTVASSFDRDQNLKGEHERNRPSFRGTSGQRGLSKSLKSASVEVEAPRPEDRYINLRHLLRILRSP